MSKRNQSMTDDAPNEIDTGRAERLAQHLAHEYGICAECARCIASAGAVLVAMGNRDTGRLPLCPEKQPNARRPRDAVVRSRAAA